MNSNHINLQALIEQLPPNPIILLEGTRNINTNTTFVLQQFAAHLAKLVPNATFRSGNATGSDEAFITGLVNVQHPRIELVLPYKNHRQKNIPLNAKTLALDAITTTELEHLKNTSINANPATKSIVSFFDFDKKGRIVENAKYLLRDILKLTGSQSQSFAPANLAFFMIDESTKKPGGTGHTMQVATHLGIQFQTQRGWAFEIPKTIYTANEIKTIDDLTESRNGDMSYYPLAETDEEKQPLQALNDNYMHQLMKLLLRL